jgi:dTDP-glucose 4,6-dehydratase
MPIILITGGAGFIGHHIVEHFLKNTDWSIVVFDKLTYASHGFNRLRDINVYDDKRVTTFTADFTKPINEGLLNEIGDVNYILHLGAETHVDNSITEPRRFVYSNVVGTLEILEFARNLRHLEKMIYFSTDEVFGPAPEGIAFKEWDRYNAKNPYAATKAGGEELCIAYENTYKLPIIITHTMNVFGERQHPEKFIPKCIIDILAGRTIEIHSNPERTKSGSRFYIHARNVASAIHFLLNSHTDNGDKFNIVGEKEVSNLDMAHDIAVILGKELKYELVDFHSSRPGHDLRYALDGTKMENMGWKIPMEFEECLSKTVNWYVRNPKWLDWSLK